MINDNKNVSRGYRKKTLTLAVENARTCLLGTAALFLMPMTLSAQEQSQEQQDPEVEEVVVTGSFIRNSQFTNASPVVTIGQDDIQQSGAANLGEYLRDMPFMENIDTVANILDTQSGQQDSNASRFNLRGLGTESTLTLVDGRRAVNETAVGALLPGIAQCSVEIVTDGGAALYGSDAVAGVANLIPCKEYDGFGSRVYYKTDEGGSMEQSTLEFIAGLEVIDNLEWVGAFEYSNRTPLLVAERPRHLEYYDQDSTSGWPGAYKDFAWMPTVGGNQVLDPDCAEFNEGAEDLSVPGALPSGTEGSLSALFNSPRCVMYFGEWQDYGRKSENYTLFNNFRYDVSDNLMLEFQMSHNYRESILTSSPSSAVTAQANLNTLLIPTAHPANPFGRDVKPTGWRPFGKGGTRPSDLNPNGTRDTDYRYYADSYKFGGSYEIPDTTWVGEAWMGYQQSRRIYDGTRISLSRMQAALRGEGGESGNEWFNPFGSADTRSPNYQAGITDNSQELVDWLHVPLKYRDTHDRLKYFDTVFAGEVMELPGGTLRAAVGGQLRHLRNFEFEDSLQTARDDLYQNIAAPLDISATRDSGVRAVFGELEIPIFSTLGVKVAARHEDFYTIGFSATKPKVSILWEPLDSLALRASYGESFLAPTARQLRPAERETCVEVTDNTIDPLTGNTLNGVESCSSGNPNVGAEESTIYNVGFSWLPIDGLSIDLDYQQIEYTDKIGTLIANEVARLDYNNYLAANNLTPETYDASNQQQRDQALAWIAANPNPLVQRGADGLIEAVIRAPVNLSSQWVEGFDLRVRYGFSYRDWGRFSVALAGNYYTRWEYQEDDKSPVVDARANQNGNTSFASPLAKFKGNLTLGWFRDNHAAAITTRYIDEIAYDENSITLGFTAPEYIRAITKVDARYSYDFMALGTDNSVTVGITNLFDRQAQRLPQSGGLETRIDDPYGRQFYVSLNTNF